MAAVGSPELLIVMGAQAPSEQVDEVVARLEEAGASAHVSQGRDATVIGAIGERELLATLPLEGFPGVEQVLPILKPYKLVSRELRRDPTVIEARGRRLGDQYFGFIAGPCTVETREQTLETARVVHAEGVTMLRGGAFKPRTSPYAFQGLGVEGLEILAEARELTGLPLVTELMDPRDVEPVVEIADVIQVGARNMQNFNLLSEVGRSPRPVLLKRGPASSIEELLMAAEYVVKEGNTQVILCERGIKTFERSTRYTLDLSAIPVLKHETHLPVIVDPSHAAGKRDLVLPLARAAVAAGADGIIVEVHPRPEEALCDGPQQIPAAEFADFAHEIRALASLLGQDDRVIRRLAIVGTGLIGASVGLAARRAGIDEVAGWDPDAAHLGTAAERGAIEPAPDLASAVRDAQLAVVAAPVTELPAQVRAVLDASGPGCLVTDVGSTKGGVAAAAGGSGRFVGGHPICGSEARGPEWATAELFEGATWFLTPVAATEPDSYKMLHGFVTALGAVPVAIDPEAHDRLVGVTSHLPHVLANVLLNQAGGARIEGHEPLAAAGGSLRDMTRVAGANPRIWVDIFLENRVALAASLAEHRRRIEQVEAALAASDAGFLARWIGEASANRRRLLDTAYGDAGALQRLRVHVPDRPGVIAGIAQALGAERVNIADFDLQHLSSERGGTIAILVAGEDEAARAAAILEEQGYGVVVAAVLDEDTS